MSFKIFTSENGLFSLTLPKDWEEYDDGEDNTCAFFNAKSWTGNFRITTFYWPHNENPDADKAAKYIEEELAQNENATKIKLGKHECAFYKKDAKDEPESLVYYWITGKKSELYLCSFTIDKEQEHKPENLIELEKIQNIIKSII